VISLARGDGEIWSDDGSEIMHGPRLRFADRSEIGRVAARVYIALRDRSVDARRRWAQRSESSPAARRLKASAHVRARSGEHPEQFQPSQLRVECVSSALALARAAA